MCKAICSLLLSRPAWGAWIEIYVTPGGETVNAVAPRMGRVD